MSLASVVRLQIENALAHRIPSALTPRQRLVRPVAPIGIEAVDELLEGGLPLGAITEMVGSESSGRSSVALSFVSRFTRAGNVCAWIDISDALDPESAAAAGIDLSRLLWVRCGAVPEDDQSGAQYKYALPEKYLVPSPVKQGLHGGGCGGHPRSEVKGLSEAVSGLLRQEAMAPRCAEPQRRVRTARETFAPFREPRQPQRKVRTRPGKPWARIEQALHAADLLLQAGGFSAIVLDMAGIPAEYASRVPLATWFRYRAAAERTQASVLLLTQHACAKSSGELLLRFQPGEARKDETTLFTGIECCLEVERRRYTQIPDTVVPLRRPAQSVKTASWRSQTTWTVLR